jgi:hypothetical protein
MRSRGTPFLLNRRGVDNSETAMTLAARLIENVRSCLCAKWFANDKWVYVVTGGQSGRVIGCRTSTLASHLFCCCEECNATQPCMSSP